MWIFRRRWLPNKSLATILSTYSVSVTNFARTLFHDLRTRSPLLTVFLRLTWSLFSRFVVFTTETSKNWWLGHFKSFSKHDTLLVLLLCHSHRHSLEKSPLHGLLSYWLLRVSGNRYVRRGLLFNCIVCDLWWFVCFSYLVFLWIIHIFRIASGT